MALTNKDYALIFTYNVKGIVCKNTFWYQATDDTIAITVAALWESTVMGDIMGVLSSEAIAGQIYCYNLVDLSDFVIYSTTPTPGSRGTDVMKAYNGWYFRYYRTTREVNNGRKTFGGVAEADVTDGEPTSTALALLNSLGTVLATPIDIPIGNQVTPCIAKTVEYTNPVTSKTYRVPETLIPIGEVDFVTLSTQNSRKR